MRRGVGIARCDVLCACACACVRELLLLNYAFNSWPGRYQYGPLRVLVRAKNMGRIKTLQILCAVGWALQGVFCCVRVHV